MRIFGTAADSYHTFRPGYPPQIAVDLAARLTGRRVVEVGAGTGKFTHTLLALGYEVTCVESDPAMAARLTAMLGDRVEVEVTPFEEWSGSSFDALVSAQAWHWVSGEDRYQRVLAALKPGGEFAAIWNDFFPDERWMADLRNGVYRRLGLELSSSTRDVPALRHEIMSAELAAVPDLAGYTVDTYRWSQPSDAARYAGYLDSTSSHLALSPDRRTALREALTAAIEEVAPDGFEVPIVTGVHRANRV